MKAESLEAVHTHTHTDSLRNRKGITLVALVVTIVVLLILAGVSINLVLGENGLITQAKEAKEQTKSAEAKEKEKMDSASDFITQTVADLPKTETTKPYMPGSEFSVLEGTNLDNGLVIQDASGNQYVWVEVPMTNDVYPTSGLNITEFNEDAYTKIENDLHQYTMSYRKGKSDTETTYKDEYAEDSTDGWFKNAEEYNQQKYKMLKSIYQNGGFWVGRYEAGIEKIRTGVGDATIIPQSKQNLYPYNYVTRTQAKRLAETVEYGSGENKHTGRLMLGVQWDLILAFLHNNGKISDEKLNKDSSTIGNYYDATYIINRGMYARNQKWNNYQNDFEEVVKDKTKMKSYSILLTTGASDQNCQMNIYDIAGNVREWTLEKNVQNNNTTPCAIRGGYYSYNGVGCPASYRDWGYTGGTGEEAGFRISIY